MSSNYQSCWQKSLALKFKNHRLLALSISIFSLYVIQQDAIADCLPSSAITPVTINDETANIPNARQLVNGTNTTIDTSTPGQVKVDLPNSGVTAGSYTSTNITVNAQGIVTSAGNGGGGTGTVSSVTAADGTLTIIPTTGSVTAKIPSSVALPGSPTTTTQNPQDNSTNIATTAYVDNATIPPWRRESWAEPNYLGGNQLITVGGFTTVSTLGNAFIQICVDGSYAMVIPYTTSTTVGSQSQIYDSDRRVTSQTAALGTFIISPGSTSNARYYVGFGDQYLAASSSLPSSANVASFRFSPADGDTTWHFVTNDGSGHLQDTDTGITPSTTVNNRLQIQLLPTGGAKAYIDGTLRATNITHYPPVTNTMNFFAQNTNTTSTATILNVGKIHCSSN